jgi:hypothetical protein
MRDPPVESTGKSTGDMGAHILARDTRVLHIDPQLRAADWKLNDRTQVRLEVPVDGYDAERGTASPTAERGAGE